MPIVSNKIQREISKYVYKIPVMAEKFVKSLDVCNLLSLNTNIIWKFEIAAHHLLWGRGYILDHTVSYQRC